MELTEKQIKQIEELTKLKLVKENSPYKIYKWGYEFQYDHSRKAREKNGIVFGVNDYGIILDQSWHNDDFLIAVFRAPAPSNSMYSALKQAERCFGEALKFPTKWLKPLGEILKGGHNGN